MRTTPTPAQRIIFDRLLLAVCEDYSADPGVVLGPSRTKAAAATRDTLCYLLYSAGLSQPVIGSLLDRDHSTISCALARYVATGRQSRRTIEREIGRLEMALESLKKAIASDTCL